MELESEYEIKSDDQFWAELVALLNTPCNSPESTDNCLRSYLAYGVKYKDEYLPTEEDFAQYAHRLRTAPVFIEQADYVRRQFVYGLLQEDDPATLHIFAVVLLCDGRANEPTFEMMKAEGAFSRLVELLQSFGVDEEHASLHRLLLNLIYEMASILTLEWHDLATIDDAFVCSLLSLIESGFSDDTDPYHYRAIRVLLVINEQYMVVGSQSPPVHSGRPSPPLTNRVLKAISTYASVYKTFGENLIYLLNREKEAILQIQILKFLYLVFSNRTTAEYFYTNDLHVLVDIILRMLRNLPADDDYYADQSDSAAMTQALRHTYLRVLHHVLLNSQLRHPGMDYKREHIIALLDILSGRRWGAAAQFVHFAPMDETTVRLADRCRSVAWLQDPDALPLPSDNDSSPVQTNGTAVNGHGLLGAGHMEVARRNLGMTVQAAGESLVQVAQHTERPGVTVPSPAVRDAS